MRKLYVKTRDTNEIVKEIEVTGDNTRKVERVMSGLLRQMNTEDYYVDDSEFDDLYED